MPMLPPVEIRKNAPVQGVLENIDNVVLITSNYWNGIEYQRHHLARHFAAAGLPVIFVERTPQRWPRFGLKDFMEWYRRSGQGADKEEKPVPEGIHIKNLRLLPPSTRLRSINRRIIKSAFEGELIDGRVAGNRTLLITYVPTYNTIDIINHIHPVKVTYVNVHNYNGERKRIIGDLLAAEKELAKSADFLFADSILLQKRLEELSGGRKVHRSLPGVDYGAFRGSYRGDEIKSRKTLYYFGGIGSHLDFELYASLAKSMKVIFIGVVDPVVRNRIPKNVETRAPVSNANLPAILRDADILSLFYKDSPYMQGVIPAKFFECIATGKPVLVSGLREATSYGNIVYNFNGRPEEAVRIIGHLPKTETPQRLAERDKIARDADWERRFSQFIESLNGNGYS